MRPIPRADERFELLGVGGRHRREVAEDREIGGLGRPREPLRVVLDADADGQVADAERGGDEVRLALERLRATARRRR